MSPQEWNPAWTRVDPAKAPLGVSPDTLRDLEHGAIPKGWTEAPRKGPRRYYGFNAMNKCCATWVLLGWPEKDGHPAKYDEGILTLDCPRCKKEQHYDLNGPSAVTVTDQHQPPAIVRGHIKGLGQ